VISNCCRVAVALGEMVDEALGDDGMTLGTTASSLAMDDGDMELEFVLGEGIILGAIVSLPPVVIGVLGADGTGVPLAMDEGEAELEADVGAAVGVSTTEGVDDGVGSADPSDAIVGEDDGIALGSGGQSTVSSGIPWKKLPS